MEVVYMSNEGFSYRDYLHLYNVVSSMGKKIDGVFQYGDIKAWHDFDGYTCWLSYKDLTVTLMFHSKFEFEYSQKDTLVEFSKQLTLLVDANSSKNKAD